MQANRSNIGMALVILLLGAVIFFLFSGNDRINWREHYYEDSKDPYGTLVIQNLLKKYIKNKSLTVLKDSLNGVLPTDSTGMNYVFIGEAIYLDSADISAILDFTAAGNKTFISGKSIPFDLFFEVYSNECPDIYWDDYRTLNQDTVTLNFDHPNLAIDTGINFQFVRRGETGNYRWAYIPNEIFCEEDNHFVKLGNMEGYMPNFAKAKYFDGEFYFHTTPIAFTNISLLEESGLEYAHKVFSHLSEGTIYWDEFSRVPESVSRMRNNSDYRNLAEESPLKYVLSQPPLAWAWYLALGLALLYVFFRGKRRQRIIPVLEKNSNNSLEFINIIGRLYFIQNNHRKLALQKMKLFLGYVRSRYYLPTKDLNEGFVKQLVAKSDVPRPVVDKILLLYKNIKNSNFVSENTLTDFHFEMEKFYKNCK